MLSLVARLSGHELLAQRSIQIASAADAVSPPLLIADLGRPERFLNMLRVFKVTSPMSVGSWILALLQHRKLGLGLPEHDRPPPARGRPRRTASAVSGAPLAVYTATLISDTAIPVWHEARRELPFLFGSSAVASAGAAAAIAVPPAEAGPARRLAVGGVLVENTVFALMEKRLGMLGEPYRRTCPASTEGLPRLHHRRCRAARGAGPAEPRRCGGRRRARAGGEVAMRWSVFKAGFQSARDPKYTVAPQRARADAARSAPRPPH